LVRGQRAAGPRGHDRFRDDEVPPVAFRVALIGPGRAFALLVLDHLPVLGAQASRAALRPGDADLRLLPPSDDSKYLTVVGVVLGASLSTLRNKEFNFRMPRHPLDHFINGFFVAMFGLTLGYCSVHIIMSLMYGSFIALVGLIGMLTGVVISANYIKWRVRL
jgi:hypothetical protein